MRKLICLAAVLALAWASTATAGEPKCPKSKQIEAKTVATKPPCGSETASADAKSCCGKCTEPCARNCDKPCPGKCAKPCSGDCGSSCCGACGQAKTVADKPPCGSHGATLAGAKSDCGKPCPGTCGKACPGECGKATTVADKSPCGAAKSAALAGAKGHCGRDRVAARLASMPKMTYKVGNLETCCKKTAKAKAQESGETIHYVVEGEAYTDYARAVESLTAVLDAKANEMRQVSYVAGGKCVHCPTAAAKLAKQGGTTVKYRVAGIDFDTKEQAEAAAKRADDAVAGIHMTYKVDGEPAACGKSAKASGKTVTFVVGDQETCCEKTAKWMMAELVLRTIIENAPEVSAETGA